jgi:hypothetical protein
MKHSAVIKELLTRAKKKIGDNSHYLDRLQIEELERLGSMVIAIQDLAINRDPKSTPEAHKLLLAEKTKKLSEERLKVEKLMFERLSNMYSSVIPLVYEEAGYKESKFASEIRGSLKSLPKSTRLESIRVAIDLKQGDVIHAIQDVPELLTGISKEDGNKYLSEYLAKHSPSFQKQLKNSESIVIEEGVNIINSVKNAEKEGFNPDDLAKIKEAEERHQQSNSAFESALKVDG